MHGAREKDHARGRKYVLSSHYQGTPYDPYAATASERGIYRPIGVNRNDFMALLQMRPDVPEDFRAVEWLAFASNAFNTMVPFYANVDSTPEYLSNTTGDVSTDNFYWASRLLRYGRCVLRKIGVPHRALHAERRQQSQRHHQHL